MKAAPQNYQARMRRRAISARGWIEHRERRCAGGSTLAAAMRREKAAGRSLRAIDSTNARHASVA